jgi:hypothetical protein
LTQQQILELCAEKDDEVTFFEDPEIRKQVLEELKATRAANQEEVEKK